MWIGMVKDCTNSIIQVNVCGFKMGIFIQVISTIAACYLCMTIGVIFTWPSCTLKIFESGNTTLHRPMTETELALFGSLSSIGALTSTPFTGYMLDIVGRKSCIIVASLTQVIAWAMIAASSQVEVVLTAVFMSGVGGSGFLIVPMLTSEICQESIRGSMTAGMMIFYAFGMLVSYVLGGLLEYKMMVYVCLSMSVLGVVLLSIIRETPLYYMKKGMEEEAAKSFAYYRHAAVDSKVVLEEMNALRRAFNPIIEEDELSPEEQKLKPELKDTEQKEEKERLSLFNFIKKSQSTRKAIVVSLVLMTASLFQGLVVVQVYAEPLFEEAVPNMSPTVCSVLLAIVTVVFGFLGAYLTDIIGRRPLIIYSSIAAMVCCVILGSQLHLSWAPHWVTAVAIYMFAITYTLGGGTVPYVFTAEIFLPEVKSFMTMMVVEWAWFCNFVILFIFTPLVSAIGLGPVFYLFAGVCLFTSIYSIFYLPETNGLPVDVIQGLFLKRQRAQKY
ncbi:facilitated trehalose transporter Tret1-2 homolog [Pectinophora gossypiella]|uniref:facilitated trehalose transporter Tret1-2 homolog n=1 Tax=Pectinophora gossypiella TaxID=13191 RepID=UPI00214ED2E8|nr:facilitated trehalose transporter Tret1-2 homolog [Pectinophora gossypiella]